MTSNSSPPVLPISNSQASDSQAPVATPAFRAFLNNLSESLRSGLANRRPWRELVDRTTFSKPESISEATFRVRKNYSYFRVNYLVIISSILAISLLSNPFSLLVLIGLFASWVFCYLLRPSDHPLVLFGRTFSDFETLALLGGLTVFVIFLTSVGSLIISSLMAGFAFVCVHGALRVPQDLFMDEQEASQAPGFLSFFRGAAANAAVSSASPTVPARA